MPTLFPRLVTSALLLVGTPGFAFAQATTPPETITPAQPEDGGGSTDPCAGQPGAQTGDGTLSGQLSDCGGVLTPPDTGASGIEVPAPDPEPNTTPVLPPSQVPEQAPNGATGSGNG